MLKFFPTKVVSIPNYPDERWSLTRVGRGKTSSSINIRHQALVPRNTNAMIGDIVTSENISYFVTTMEKSFINTVCQLIKSNAIIDIVRVTKHIVGKVIDGDYEAPLFTLVTAYYEDITGRMQQFDAGLKSTSTRRFLTPILGYELLDRIKFDDEPMRIDGISTSAYPGLLWIQCSPDIRVTKVFV